VIVKNSLFDNGANYYKGWTGALESTYNENSNRYIPIKFSILESGKGGDIVITLTNLRNGDGLSGTTKAIMDVNQNQILKSHITIYEVDKITAEKFEAIFRHEFGHALGLAHSTAVEDLMHSSIQTDFPYISECDVDGIFSLYDERNPSQVVCEN